MGILIAVIILTGIFCLPLSVRVKSTDGFSLTVGVGWIKIKIFPAKEKKLSLKNFRIDRFRKKYGSLSEEIGEDTEEQISEKSAKKPKRPADTADKPKEKEKRDIPALIRKLTHVAGVFFKCFGRHLRIDLYSVVLIIGTPDAAKTAVLYGAVIGAVQNLYAFLLSTGTLKMHGNSRLLVDADFLSEKPTVKIDLRFTFRVWHIFDMAIRSLIAYLKTE